MRSVLLIDDDSMSRELFTHLLEAEGYSVRACESGDAAIALLHADNCQPHVILTDMQMPGTTGTALAQAVRTLCPLSVIVGMSASQLRSLPAGFDTFLLKPFDGAQFTQALQTKSPAKTAASTKSTEVPDLDEAIAGSLAVAMPAEQLAALYALSLSDTRKRVVAMRQSLAAGDDDAFRRGAHAIKGGAGMLGAFAMAELARQMEETGISGDAPRLLDDLIAAAARLEGILLLRLPNSTSTTEPR
jgi:CheY-like chemotaxis protein